MMGKIAFVLLALFLFAIFDNSLGQNAKQQKSKQHEVEDNEFAEFDSEDDDSSRRKQKEQPKRAAAESDAQKLDRVSQEESRERSNEIDRDADTDKQVENDADEAGGDAFVELESDEFADIETGDAEDREAEAARQRSAAKQQPGGKMNLQFTQVPANAMQSGLHAYLFEGCLIAGLMVFMANYVFGKSRNTRIASEYISAIRDLLDVQFALVGDDPQAKELPQTSGSEDSERPSDTSSSSVSSVDPSSLLIKETESVYRLWCSGRSAVEGLLVELRLLKRQDLISVMHDTFVPSSNDHVHITVYMERDEMDSFVFAVAKKRAASRLLKDYSDISMFCPDKKNPDLKFSITSQFVMFSEIGEATRAFLSDQKVTSFFDKYEDYVEYVHFSDQYVGQKVLTADDQSTSNTSSTTNPSTGTELSEPKKALAFCFNLSRNGRAVQADDVNAHRALFQFVFFCIDRVRRIRLSREAKQKADRNRSKAIEQADKKQHASRQELAQQRKEEKRRADKEKLLNEDDLSKIKKLEDKQQKDERKMKQPKMKMMRIKGGFA